MADIDQTAQNVACAAARQSSHLPTNGEIRAAARLTPEERNFLLRGNEEEVDPLAEMRKKAIQTLIQLKNQKSRQPSTADNT